MAPPLIEAWTNAGLGAARSSTSPTPSSPSSPSSSLRLIVGLFGASPVVFYQIWAFVAPGLYRNEHRYALPFGILSGLFFTGGAAFGYFMVFPYGFKFFLGFAKANMGALNEVMGSRST